MAFITGQSKLVLESWYRGGGLERGLSAVSQTDFSSAVQVRLQSFGVKIANFSPLYCIAIRRRDMSSKKTKPNTENRTESLRVTLEF